MRAQLHLHSTRSMALTRGIYLMLTHKAGSCLFAAIIAAYTLLATLYAARDMCWSADVVCVLTGGINAVFLVSLIKLAPPGTYFLLVHLCVQKLS